MGDITITEFSGKLHVSSPYHPDFPELARRNGGRFNRDNSTWVFDPRDEAKVRDILKEVYGTDGSAVGETVTVRLGMGPWTNEQTCWFAGRKVAHRPGRDGEVVLGAGVVIVSGNFSGSGGSMKYPTLGNYGEELPVVEVRDIPAGHPDLKEYANRLTVVSKEVSREALEEEKATLLARLDEINQLLGAPTS